MPDSQLSTFAASLANAAQIAASWSARLAEYPAEYPHKTLLTLPNLPWPAARAALDHGWGVIALMGDDPSGTFLMDIEGCGLIRFDWDTNASGPHTLTAEEIAFCAWGVVIP